MRLELENFATESPLFGANSKLESQLASQIIFEILLVIVYLQRPSVTATNVLLFFSQRI